MIPTLKNGCCGCTLQTSSLVIAWIQFIFSTLWLLLVSIFGTIIIAWVMNHEGENGSGKVNPESELAMQVVLGVLIAVLVISFLIDLGLLVGIYKRNYCLMMPYLILGGVGVVFSIISVIIGFFSIFANVANFGNFFIYLIYSAISGYFWLILYSNFKEIKTETLVNQNTFNKI